MRNGDAVRAFERLLFNMRLPKNGSLHRKLTPGIASADLYGGHFPARFSSEIGEELINGSMRLMPWLDGIPYASLDSFDWNGDYTQTPTTYQLLLQALNPVMHLSGAFVLSGNEEYFWKAYDIYKSWKKFEQSKESNRNDYVWDQHAAALRAESLLGFLLVGIERELLTKRQIYEIEGDLVRHARFHMDEGVYLAGENHGLYQDRALLYLGYAFDCDDWIEASIGRIKDQWNGLFDAEGVCVENSFAYQRVDKNLFIDIYYILGKKGNPIAQSLFDDICKAEDFMGHSLMPNCVCPPYGDTFRHDYSMCAVMDEAGLLSYASSQGKKGEAPLHANRLYFSAGYYFGRQYWTPPLPDLHFEDAVWTMFRSGYASITHRQADDNSFMFYAFGKEIFTDGGAYNYMYRDPIRRYVRSTLAHNVIAVDGASYDFLQRGNVDLSGFCHCDLGIAGMADYIVGYSSHYRGVVWFRHFIFFSRGVFLLDEVFSDGQHRYSQLFHTGPEIQEVRVNGLDLEIPLESKGSRCVSLFQLDSDDLISLIDHSGDGSSRHAPIPFGIVGGSEINELEYVHTFEYAQEGKRASFATSIIACDDACAVDVAFDKRSRRVHVSHGEEQCEVELKALDPARFAPASRFPFDRFSILHEGSVFRVSYPDSLLPEMELAWYVMGNHGRRAIHRSSYAGDRVFEYDFGGVDDPDCAIRVFARDPGTGEMGSQIICGINRDSDTGEWRYEYWPDWDEGWHEWFGGTEVPFRSS